MLGKTVDALSVWQSFLLASVPTSVSGVGLGVGDHRDGWGRLCASHRRSSHSTFLEVTARVRLTWPGSLAGLARPSAGAESHHLDRDWGEALTTRTPGT